LLVFPSKVCAAFPAITAIGKGYDAYVAVVASGTFSETKRQVDIDEILGPIEQSARAFSEFDPNRGRRNRSLRALEQNNAEQVLELLHSGAQSRLADETIFGSFSEMTAVDHGHKKTQLPEGGQIFHQAILIVFYDLFYRNFSLLSMRWQD